MDKLSALVCPLKHHYMGTYFYKCEGPEGGVVSSSHLLDLTPLDLLSSHPQGWGSSLWAGEQTLSGTNSIFLQTYLHLLTGLKTESQGATTICLGSPRTNCSMFAILACITGHEKPRLPGRPTSLILYFPSGSSHPSCCIHLPITRSSQDTPHPHSVQGALWIHNPSSATSIISSASSLNVPSSWGPCWGHCSPRRQRWCFPSFFWHLWAWRQSGCPPCPATLPPYHSPSFLAKTLSLSLKLSPSITHYLSQLLWPFSSLDYFSFWLTVTLSRTVSLPSLGDFNTHIDGTSNLSS